MGRSNPLTAEERTRLTRMVSDTGRHAVAFWDPKKQKMNQSYDQKGVAWNQSVKCNPHNLPPPPNALLATTDEAENDENEVTDQNVPLSGQLVVREDQQSLGSPGQQSPGSPGQQSGQQSPGSRGSEQTEQLSRSPREEAVSPVATLRELGAAADRDWPSVSSPLAAASTPRRRRSTLSDDERVSSVP